MQQIPEQIKKISRKLYITSKAFLSKIQADLFSVLIGKQQILPKKKEELTSLLHSSKQKVSDVFQENKEVISTGLGGGATFAGVIITIDIVVTLAGESEDATDLFLAIIAGIYGTFAIVLLAKGIIGRNEE